MRVTRALIAMASLLVVSANADAASITFTKLNFVVGSAPSAATAVYVADLGASGIGTVASITIQDANVLGGAFGLFSGFDLDAIGISDTLCAPSDSACFAGLTFQNVFNFPGGLAFTPGVMVADLDPTLNVGPLFGTTGSAVNNAVATLQAFDAVSSTSLATANGFLSMGFGGALSLNLTGPIPTAGRYLYIGEVGDNGEVAAGNITISETPVTPVPEPSSMILLGTGVAALVARRRRARR